MQKEEMILDNQKKDDTIQDILRNKIPQIEASRNKLIHQDQLRNSLDIQKNIPIKFKQSKCHLITFSSEEMEPVIELIGSQPNDKQYIKNSVQKKSISQLDQLIESDFSSRKFYLNSQQSYLTKPPFPHSISSPINKNQDSVFQGELSCVLSKQETPNSIQFPCDQNNPLTKIKTKYHYRASIGASLKQNSFGMSKHSNNKNEFLKLERNFHSQLLNLGILMKNILHFYKNYTFTGKASYLSNPKVRQIINDRCDVIGQNQFHINSIERGCRQYMNYLYQCLHQNKIDFSLVNPQSFITIFIQIIFFSMNCIYYFLLSLSIVFRNPQLVSGQITSGIFFLWILEIVMRLNTPVFSRKLYMKTRKDILFYYLQNRIIFDVVPIIFAQFNTTSYTGLTLIGMEIPLFIKLVNILRDKQEIEKQLVVILRNYYVLQLFNLIFTLFTVGHVISCLWYLLSVFDKEYLNSQNAWVNIQLQNNPDIPQDLQWQNLYLLSFYWSFTLMATGSNVANTTLEIYFTSFIMLFTTIIFGYMVNTIGIILSDINKQKELEQRDINIINGYMEKRKIPTILKRKVNLDIENYYLKSLMQQSNEENEVLSKISFELNQALKLEYNKNILQQIKPLTQNFSAKIMHQLCLEVQEVYFSPNQSIFKEGDSSDSSLMFIVEGEVEIFQKQIQNDDKNNIKGELQFLFEVELKSLYLVGNKYRDWRRQLDSERYSKILGRLKAGMSFGELNFFTGMARKGSAKAKDFTTILKVDRNVFLRIIKEEKHDFEVFSQIKDKILLYNDYSTVNQGCTICKSSFHMNNLCPTVHFDKDNPYILARLTYTCPQFRQKFSRNFSKKSRGLPLDLFDASCLIMNNIIQDQSQNNQLLVYIEQNEQDDISSQSEDQSEEDIKNDDSKLNLNIPFYQDQIDRQFQEINFKRISIADQIQFMEQREEGEVQKYDQQYQAQKNELIKLSNVLPQSRFFNERIQQISQNIFDMKDNPQRIINSQRTMFKEKSLSNQIINSFKDFQNQHKKARKSNLKEGGGNQMCPKSGLIFGFCETNKYLSEWDFEKQQDYSVYFPEGNLRFVQNKINILRKRMLKGEKNYLKGVKRQLKS